jgi:hypothetical protein
LIKLKAGLKLATNPFVARILQHLRQELQRNRPRSIANADGRAVGDFLGTRRRVKLLITAGKQKKKTNRLSMAQYVSISQSDPDHKHFQSGYPLRINDFLGAGEQN